MQKWDIARGAKKTNCLDLKRYALNALLKIRTELKERERLVGKNTMST